MSDREKKQPHKDWWRVEKFQDLLKGKADKTNDPEGKALYTLSSTRFNALVENTLRGSFGIAAGKPATFDEVFQEAVNPINEVRKLVDSGRSDLSNDWEDVLKSFQFFGGPMTEVLQEVQAVRVPTAALKRAVIAPEPATFKKR